MEALKELMVIRKSAILALQNPYKWKGFELEVIRPILPQRIIAGSW
jgi:hypothetical protein